MDPIVGDILVRLGLAHLHLIVSDFWRRRRGEEAGYGVARARGDFSTSCMFSHPEEKATAAPRVNSKGFIFLPAWQISSSSDWALLSSSFVSFATSSPIYTSRVSPLNSAPRKELSSTLSWPWLAPTARFSPLDCWRQSFLPQNLPPLSWDNLNIYKYDYFLNCNAPAAHLRRTCDAPATHLRRNLRRNLCFLKSAMGKSVVFWHPCHEINIIIAHI